MKIFLLLASILFYSFPLWAYGDSLMFLGDSNPARYGLHMVKLLEDEFERVVYYGLPGARPASFLGNQRARFFGGAYIYPARADVLRSALVPKLKELIQRHRPSYLLIALGGNMMPLTLRRRYTNQAVIPMTKKDLLAPSTKRRYGTRWVRRQQAYLKRLDRELKHFMGHIPSHIGCFWIGPPKGADTHLKPQFFIDQMQESLKGKCHFVDGRLVDFPTSEARDPVHYPWGSTQLPEAVFAEFMQFYSAR